MAENNKVLRVTEKNILKQLNWTKGVPLAFVLLLFLISAISINTNFSTDKFESISVEAKVSPNTTKQFPVPILINVNPISSEEDDREDTKGKKLDLDDNLDVKQPILIQGIKSSWLTLCQLEKNFNNRSSISLFILHHSWKGLLS